MPRYQQLVGSHLRRGGTTPLGALAALAAFGIVIVTHTFVQVVSPDSMRQAHLTMTSAAQSSGSTHAGTGQHDRAADQQRHCVISQRGRALRRQRMLLCCRAGCTGRRARWRWAWSAR